MEAVPQQVITALEGLHGSSVQKLLGFLEAVSDLDDDDLEDALPIMSATKLRLGLSAAARTIPTNAPELLDEYMQLAAILALHMRSDTAPALTLSEGAPA